MSRCGIARRPPGSLVDEPLSSLQSGKVHAKLNLRFTE